LALTSAKIWRPKWYRRTGWQLIACGLVGVALGTAATMPGWTNRLGIADSITTAPVTVVRPNGMAPAAVSRSTPVFGRCGSASASDCVVDGDTFRFQGDVIRIADIDAPETRDAKCASEAQLAARATVRLAHLLSQGDFDLVRYESRDRDRYGRLLRVVTRNGASIGQILVSEGLARRWEGRRRPWC
jgi:micrococcal nuclease